jgi:phosphatidyl-myo-inositol dimannoside synthase
LVRSLLLTTSFPPTLGGVETLLYQTNRRLREPPLVLAGAPAAAADMRVEPIRLGPASRAAYRPLWALHPSLHYVQTFWTAALRAVSEHKPEVLQVGHVYLAPLAWLLARRRGLPFIVYAYGQEVWREGRAIGRAALDARLRGQALRSADRVLSLGGFTSSLLADWRVSAERIVEVPYGAEPRPASAVPSGCVLLSVARLVPRKGIDMVIRALPQLPEGVQYRIVGGGPDEARLRGLAASEGVSERVHFLGRVDAATLDAEYQRCAVFVLPSRRTPDGGVEGYGLVYFEAAAWGRPVVAGRSGGEADAVIDGQTGVLVDGESVDRVADAIGALLADPARLGRLGAAGRLRVESTHNWVCAARVVDQTLASLR